MRLPLIAALCLLSGSAFAPAFANDSSVTLGAGGLVLTKSADIAMRSEDLTISPTRVEVRYVFVNESAGDLDETVAFPLPDIDNENLWEAPRGAMTGDPVNFVGFEAASDGKPIAVSVEQRALLKGRDVTAEVKAAGLPVNLSTDAGVKALDALPKAARNTLKAEGLIVWDPRYDYIRPNWTVATKFYWRQHFPAGKPVTITHSYQPVTGRSFFTETALAPAAEDAPSQYVGPYCMDAGTRALARKRLAQGTTYPGSQMGPGMLVAYETEYVLVTANNWEGPIGRFHLTLDKLKPSNVLSLCWDGDLKKTGPTTFEAVRENFAPTRDISMLVLE